MAALRRGADWRRLIKPNAAFAAMLLVAAYVSLSTVWAADPEAAIVKGILLFAVVFVTFAAIGALTEGDAEQLRRATLAYAAGAFLGGLFMLFELVTDGALTRAYATFVWVQPGDMKHMQFVDGRATGLRLSQLNQNVAIIMFNLWSGLLALQILEEPRRRGVASLLFALAIAIPVVFSYHQASQLALILSVPAFFAARLWPKITFRTLAVVWCLGFALVLPLNFLAYHTNLHFAEWMPASFRARIIIWEYTSERVLERPLLGIGARSTRAVRELKEQSEKPEGFIYPRNTGLHAHNLFLQTWYELGLLGVILIGAAGAIIALGISLLPSGAGPYAAATFATFLGVASSAWGMWQTWLICGVALMAVCLRLAVEGYRGTLDTPRSNETG